VELPYFHIIVPAAKKPLTKSCKNYQAINLVAEECPAILHGITWYPYQGKVLVKHLVARKIPVSIKLPQLMILL